MLGASVFSSLAAGSVAYSIIDYTLHHGSLPLGGLAIALQPTWAPALVLVAGCLWLFPDGHLPSGRRWHCHDQRAPAPGVPLGVR